MAPLSGLIVVTAARVVMLLLSLELAGSSWVHASHGGQSASWSVEALPSGAGVSAVWLRSGTHALQVTWGRFVPAVGSSLSDSSASEESSLCPQACALLTAQAFHELTKRAGECPQMLTTPVLRTRACGPF